MLAGAGAAIELQTGIPAIVGSAIMAAVCVVSILAGTSGLVIVQKIVVPLIIVVAVGVAAWAIVNAGPSTGQAAADMVNSSPLINNWMLSGVLYVAFNIQLVYAVFAPVGKESKGGLTLFSGALLGALGIGVMAGAMVWALSANAGLVIIALLVATFIVRHRRGELSGPHSEDRAVRASSDA